MFYGSWTIDEAEDIGKKFKAVCHSPYSYGGQLTKDKEYEITIETRILPMSPICSFVNDRGNTSEAHLERFTKKED